MLKKLIIVGIVLVLLAMILGHIFQGDRFDPESVRGKRVLITGASSGIGEEMAYHYARLGASVIITARRESLLKKVVARCQELSKTDGEKHYYFPADMGSEKDIEKLYQFTQEKFGVLDILVLNHAIIPMMTPWLGSKENLTTLQNVMDVNFKGSAYLASLLLNSLEKSSGRIAVVSSVAGKIPNPLMVPYCSSKFALDGFFSSLRSELRLRGSGTSVTLCVIGFVGTDKGIEALRSHFGDILTGPNSPMDVGVPTEVALDIIEGTMTRQREVHSPMKQGITYMLKFRTLFPEAFDKYLVKSYAELPEKK